MATSKAQSIDVRLQSVERRQRAHFAREIERDARLDLLEARLGQLVGALDVFFADWGAALKTGDRVAGMDDIIVIAKKIEQTARTARKSLPK